MQIDNGLPSILSVFEILIIPALVENDDFYASIQLTTLNLKSSVDRDSNKSSHEKKTPIFHDATHL